MLINVMVKYKIWKLVVFEMYTIFIMEVSLTWMRDISNEMESYLLLVITKIHENCFRNISRAF